MKTLTIKKAFNFPFNRAVAMWNILWILLPIFGWLALGGYGVRVVRGFIKGKFEKLPVMNFSSDMKLGWYMFVRTLPFFLLFTAISSVLEGLLIGLVFDFTAGMFIVPILTVNFIKKGTVASYFEFNTLGVVWNNLGDYIVTMLKSIALGLVFLLMFLVLVGIPASSFTSNIFIADFYRRHVK